jgi:porphobilinogen synthase
MNNQFPQVRLRRLRQNDTIRNMLATPLPPPEKFIWPTFVVEGYGIKEPISSMPGQFRYSIDTLLEAVGELMATGVKSVMLFGVISNSNKSCDAAYAMRDDSIVQCAIRALKKNYPELLVFTDLCVCEYTDHGHCGIIDNTGAVLNDPSLELLTQMATSHARAGADVVAPSAMMDGQINAIRAALDANNFTDTILMSYSTKFSSSMYGPFREAADSAPNIGDRQTYQADFRNPNSALRESELDEAEGADILMVKPAMLYLDLITRIKQQTKLPLAAYNVSGEYAMLIATADRGWGDLKMMVRESIFAMDRAGVDIFISYWANQYKIMLND